MTSERGPIPDEADTPERFCADFGEQLKVAGLSMRGAEKVSGWSKSSINAAVRGPRLPNLQLVRDVLAAAGAPGDDLDMWSERHHLLAQPRAEVETDHASEAATKSGTDSGGGSTATRHDGRRRVNWSIAAAGLVVPGVVITGVVLYLHWHPSHEIVVQNKVAVGASGLIEDDTPSYLAKRPIRRCANVPGCKLSGTNLVTGDTVLAVCHLEGVALTNGNRHSPEIGRNPNLAASSLWYRIKWKDGRLGYLSEVYVAPSYRGGMGLPTC